jgi:hypothetical protein
MSNITENLENSTTGSSLYCVWVSAHDEGGDRLVAIWIDPALTAFKAQMQENTYEHWPSELVARTTREPIES